MLIIKRILVFGLTLFMGISGTKSITFENGMDYSAIPNQNICLKPVESSAQDGLYSEFTLRINDKSKTFNWKNAVSQSYAPELIYEDINNDQKEELIVILTEATGTGLHIQNIHVINPDSFEEIELENPFNIFKENVNTNVYKDKIDIEINDKVFTVPKEKIDLDTKDWADNVMYKNHLGFSIKDNKIVANLDINIGFLVGYFGAVEIVYDFKDGKYVMDTIDFREY